jgi:hypothetical protein
VVDVVDADDEAAVHTRVFSSSVVDAAVAVGAGDFGVVVGVFSRAGYRNPVADT